MPTSILSERNHQSLPDLSGEKYDLILKRLHDHLLPKSYLEIGVFRGDTLKHSRCQTIAVDPKFDLQQSGVLNQTALHLFQMRSDDFFGAYSPTCIFGRPIDLAFLDGMHRCEFLLRDFINTERHCKRNSIIALHDCLPPEVALTYRTPMGGRDKVIEHHREQWWTGDVWRTSLLLKRRRPDLKMIVLDAAPTGLVLITNLDSLNTSLSEDYQTCLDDMFGWNLDEIGIENYFEEMGVVHTGKFQENSDITERLWL